MGAYEQHAERLIERGYAAIPIMPGSKIPGFLCAGLWVRRHGRRWHAAEAHAHALSVRAPRLDHNVPPVFLRARRLEGSAARQRRLDDAADAPGLVREGSHH